MDSVLGFLSHHPELLLFLVIGLGSLVGRYCAAGISLGSAAVLFVAIAISAMGTATGHQVVVPAIIGHLGLALFTFCVGIASGPNFIHTMRTSATAVLGVVIALTAAALVALGLGPVFGLTREQAVGTFAGAVTNTPALAAAGDSPSATVGYSVAYLFGVIGILVLTNVSLRHRGEDSDAPSPLVHVDVRVERRDNPHVRDIEEDHDNKVTITRLRHEEDGPVTLAAQRAPLSYNDVVTVVGPQVVVDEVITDLGHRSTHHLEWDRRDLDFRRITVSSTKIAGLTLREIDLEGRFQGVISRVRRGDVDMIGNAELVLQLGDRVRVVAPRSRINEISEYLGDSSRGLTDVNPMALGAGMALGIALGAIPLPLPSGGTFTLGPALGALLVGLLFGHLGRVGSVVVTLPFTATAIMAELGLLMFLAQAGLRAGGQIGHAFTSGSWLGMLALGVVITLTVGLVNYVFQRRVMRMGGTRLSGVLAGTQTQPALLAYANRQTGHDFRVSMGYAMVYPAAMITKILAASLLSMT